MRLVSRDPVLSVKLIHFANSAAFSLHAEVTSVQRALSVIGLRALRNLAICFAACDAVDQSELGDFDLHGFLEDSLRRGAAAETLARHASGVDPDEAFTAGLIQDFGLLALVMTQPTLAGRWASCRGEPASHRRELERALFGQTHDEVGRILGRKWHLPSALADVLAYHHRASEGPIRAVALVRVAEAAEHIADVYTVSDKQAALDNAHQFLAEAFGLPGDTVRAIIEQVPEAVQRYASGLGVLVGRQPTFAEVMEEIREQTRLLAEMNLSYQRQTWKLQELLREKERIERELRLAQIRLERLALTDPLTELPNRRNFEEQLHRELERVRRTGEPLSLLIGDIDHFKAVNDTWGHPFGDQVLRTVARALSRSVRATDLVARVGGEEFAVLLPSARHEEAHRVAERLRTAVSEATVDRDGEPFSVTISVGGVTVDSVPDTGPTIRERLVERADRALYRAKKLGRNRVVWARGALAGTQWSTSPTRATG